MRVNTWIGGIVLALLALGRPLGAVAAPPQSSVAGSGVVELRTGVFDVKGDYAATLTEGDLSLSLSYDSKGALTGTGALADETFAVAGSVTVNKKGQSLSLRSTTRGIKLKLGALVTSSGISGKLVYASATRQVGSKRAPATVALELPPSATDGVQVAYSFAQDAAGRVSATADVLVPGGRILALTGKGKVVNKRGRESAQITLKAKGASIVVAGAVAPGRFDATWTLTLPGGVRDAKAFQALPPAPAVTVPSIFGSVADATTRQPLADARVTVLGLANEVRSSTGGAFAYPTPGTGTFQVQVEHDGYAYAHRLVQTTAGQDAVAEPVFLLPLDAAVTAIGPAGGTHTSSGGDVEVILPPGAVGETIQVRATNTSASRQLPAPLPDTTSYLACVNLQPELQEFSAPVTVRVKNDLGFTAGTRIPVGIYRKDGDTWDDAGMSVVTADGAWIEFQTGHFSWLAPSCIARAPDGAGAPSPGPGTDPDENPPADPSNSTCGGSRVSSRTGELLVEHTAPTYRSLGRERGVRIVYASRSASPSVFLERSFAQDGLADSHGIYATVGNRAFFPAHQYPSDRVQGRLRRLGYMWDGRSGYVLDRIGDPLPTGCYPGSITLTSYYDSDYYTQTRFAGPGLFSTGKRSREPRQFSTTISGYVTLRNGTESAFGAGWDLDGVHRILRRPDGVLVSLEGDGSSRVFRPGPIISTVAGSGSAVFSGDGGSALAAGMYAGGVAVDPAGNVYVSDMFNGRVRRIDPNGVVSTVAVLGPLGQNLGPVANSPDQILALRSEIPVGPAQLALDAAGNLYIAGLSTYSVWKLTPDGTLTRFAGNGGFGSGGDGGPAAQANLAYPHGVAVDTSGNVFIADWYNTRVRKVTPDGVISTLATFNNHPSGVAVDADGNVFVATAHRNGGHDSIVYKISPSGTVSPFSGRAGGGAYDGDGVPAASTRMSGPWGLCVDRDGSLLIADSGNNRIRRVDSNGIISTVAGTGTRGSSGDGGTAASAQLNTPVGMAIGPDGDLYIADLLNFRVRRVRKSYVGLPDAGVIEEDAEGELTRHYPDGSVAHYDSDGSQVGQVDRNGNTTTFQYSAVNGLKRLVSAADPLGRTTSFEYDGRGRLQASTDPCGRTTQFLVNAFGDLVKITNPDGTARTFEYDAAHRMTAAIDSGGARTEYYYDKLGAVFRTVKAAGTAVAQSRRFAATATVGLANWLHVAGGFIQFDGDNFIDLREPPDLDRLYSAVIDAPGGRSTWRTISRDKLSPLGSFTERTDALGNTIALERDSRNLASKVTRRTGSTVETRYDVRGNPTRTTDNATGAVTALEWHSALRVPTKVTDPVGAVTRFEYDVRGNLTRAVDPAGAATTFAYDARGLLERRTDALGNSTTYEYDADGNVAAVIDAAGARTALTCDACGRVIAVRDANGNTTQYTYDAMNLLTEIRDALGGVTKFTYAPAKGTNDSSSREPLAVLTTLTDAAGHATTFTYDGLARLVKQTDPLGRFVEFAYDSENRLVRRVNARGQRTDFRYDAAGRLVAKDLPGPDPVVYEYDADGRLLRIADSDSDLRMTVDGAGRVTQVAAQAAAGYPGNTIGYEYDAANRVTAMIDPFGGRTTYAHDLRGLVTRIVDPGANTTTFAYDALRRTSQMTAFNGVVCDYSYDVVTNLTRIAYTKSAATVAQFDYTHDAVHNVASMADSTGANEYTFDDIYRLTGATHGYAANPTESFSYDAVGNRVSSHLSATHSHTAANELTADASFAYAYDVDGNMTSRTRRSNAGDVTRYGYDGENRLVRVDLPDDSVVTYRYDGLGRRIAKTIGGATTFFLYGGLDLLYELDGSGGVIARYTHGPGIDRVIVMVRDGRRYQYVSDNLGSVRGLVDESGFTVGSYVYDSFGRIVHRSGGVANPFTYTGREADTEVGLYYYRARYYDPDAGRFISYDPAGLGAGVNGYQYVNGNPASLTDPHGLCPCGSPEDAIRQARGDGVGSWAYNGDRGFGFGPGTWKCNLFVDVQYERSGSHLPNIGGGWVANNLDLYPPGAWFLADPDNYVPGWPVVFGPPVPGDLVACNGHVGIATDPGQTISAATEGVKEGPWPWGGDGQCAPVIRRCACQ